MSLREAAVLTPSQRLTVLGLADEADCAHEMLVAADWDGMIEDLRLEAIWPRNVDAATLQAVADWRDWFERGYRL